MDVIILIEIVFLLIWIIENIDTIRTTRNKPLTVFDIIKIRSAKPPKLKTAAKFMLYFITVIKAALDSFIVGLFTCQVFNAESTIAFTMMIVTAFLSYLCYKRRPSIKQVFDSEVDEDYLVAVFAADRTSPISMTMTVIGIIWIVYLIIQV